MINGDIEVRKATSYELRAASQEQVPEASSRPTIFNFLR